MEVVQCLEDAVVVALCLIDALVSLSLFSSFHIRHYTEVLQCLEDAIEVAQCHVVAEAS